MLDKNEEYSTIQIKVKTKYLNRLRELKGTRQDWFTFCIKSILVEDQKQQSIEREMNKTH